MEILNGIRATIVLGHVVGRYAELNKDAFTAAIRGQTFGVSTGQDAGRPDYNLSLDMLADLFANEADRKSMLGNLNLFMKQELVRTAYEYIGHYCAERNIYPTMQKEPWWMFTRIIRNTLSHRTGVILHTWPKDAPPSVTWNGRTISKSDLGTLLSIDADEAWHLFDAMAAFARTLPE
jgi:hypothetical protein